MLDVMIVVQNAHGLTFRVYEHIVSVPFGSMQPVHVHARAILAQCERSWGITCKYDYVILD